MGGSGGRPGRVRWPPERPGDGPGRPKSGQERPRRRQERAKSASQSARDAFLGRALPRTARARRPGRFSDVFLSVCWTAASHTQLRERAIARGLRSVFRTPSRRTAGRANLDFCAPCAGFKRFYKDRRSASRSRARGARTRKSNAGRAKNTNVRSKNRYAARSATNPRKTSVSAFRNGPGPRKSCPGPPRTPQKRAKFEQKRARSSPGASENGNAWSNEGFERRSARRKRAGSGPSPRAISCLI